MTKSNGTNPKNRRKGNPFMGQPRLRITPDNTERKYKFTVLFMVFDILRIRQSGR
jgi:hypothetical protein